MKNLKFALLAGVILIILSNTSCEKQETVTNLQPQVETTPAFAAIAQTSSKMLEWNGMGQGNCRCYDYPCDCVNACDGLNPEDWGWTTEEYAVFMKQIEDGTVQEWYASGEGQNILPLPDLQLEDVLNGTVTFKYFADGGGYFHLVYTDATDLFDRPDYD